jgi:hypothetical protein
MTAAEVAERMESLHPEIINGFIITVPKTIRKLRNNHGEHSGRMLKI